jgi:hypothetical protein
VGRGQSGEVHVIEYLLHDLITGLVHIGPLEDLPQYELNDLLIGEEVETEYHNHSDQFLVLSLGLEVLHPRSELCSDLVLSLEVALHALLAIDLAPHQCDEGSDPLTLPRTREHLIQDGLVAVLERLQVVGVLGEVEEARALLHELLYVYQQYGL